MLKDQINAFYLQRGMLVRFNTLGYTKQLVDAYVSEVGRKLQVGVSSHDIKYQLYTEYYPFEFRLKYTGFENFGKLDTVVRTELATLQSDRFPTHIELAVNVPSESTTTVRYLNLLSATFDPTRHYVLYLSGGLDNSELVARVLLDLKLNFTPVIFNWVDAAGNIQNHHDTTHATRFCTKFNLTPIYRTVYLDVLWQSQKFREFAVSINQISPQIATEAYMPQMVGDRFKHSVHLFGGEVRINRLTDIDFAAGFKPTFAALGRTYDVAFNNEVPLGNGGIRLIFNYTGNSGDLQTYRIERTGDTSAIRMQNPATTPPTTISSQNAYTGTWLYSGSFPSGKQLIWSIDNLRIGDSNRTMNVGDNVIVSLESNKHAQILSSFKVYLWERDTPAATSVYSVARLALYTVPSTSTKTRVAFFGDSVTAGDQGNGVLLNPTPVEYMQSLLPNHQAQDFSMGAELAAMILTGIEIFQTPTVSAPIPVKHKPFATWITENPAQIIVFRVGGADAVMGTSTASVESSLRQLIGIAKANGRKVLVVGVTNTSSLLGSTILGLRNANNAMCSRVAAELGTSFVDVSSIPYTDADFPDNMHPNRRYSDLQSQAIVAAIKLM